MHRLFICCLVLTIVVSLVYASDVKGVPSLPYCPNKNGSGLVLVSTLDGKLSALNSSGQLHWTIDTGPGPLLMSNIHNLELTNNGEWVRIIPSLSGMLYKFDGYTIDPIPISAENLLKSSFKYSDDLVIAGGIEVRTYGVGFHTGKVFYECTPLKCSNEQEEDVEDVLLVERNTQIIRAVEPTTGSERWNFSVGLHDVKLRRVSCIESSTKLFDWNLTAILPEGVLRASTVKRNVEHSWQYKFPVPIVRVWHWTGVELTEINLFAPRNIPSVVLPAPISPSIYIGMHKKQLYIHESVIMQNILHGKQDKRLAVTETTSIAKIPWKPIPASTEITEDDSTALSVLNGSEYVNGNGYYLYSESELKTKDLCDKNDSVVETIPTEEEMLDDFIFAFPYPFKYFKEILLMAVTIIMCKFLFKIWNSSSPPNQEIIIIEKPVVANVTKPTERRISEKENDTFTSRYIDDFDTIRCLGKGGFGVVFEVKQKIDECYYAIKRITLPNEQLSRDRVMREVKALAKLDHQNIVRYFCSWVEHPPLGWEEEHDKTWVEDKSLVFSEETSQTPSKLKRNKSVSVSIDISLKNINQQLSDDEDDSFIVFEKDSEAISSNGTVKTLTTCSTVSLSEHSLKKINWRRPGRKHHSWDISQNNLIVPAPVYLYIQMQLCQKESLKEWLSTHQKRDYKIVLDIFGQILDAVEYVHLRGLIHRDLKPSNIFFSLEGQIKVGDFGLVKDMEDSLDFELIKKNSPTASHKGHTREVGTQLYMSPEQFSRSYNYKVDIYSLGLIFFELLVPFSTDMERIKILSDVKNNKYPDGFAEKFPDEYDLLRSMLCIDPGKRLTIIGVKAKPPFSKINPSYGENYHYELTNIPKN